MIDLLLNEILLLIDSPKVNNFFGPTSKKADPRAWIGLFSGDTQSIPGLSAAGSDRQGVSWW